MNTEIWARYLERLKNQVNERYIAYIEKMTCRSMTDHHWELCLPSRSMLNAVESNLSETMTAVLQKVVSEFGYKGDVSLSFSVEGENTRSESGYLPFDRMTVQNVSVIEEEKAAFQIAKSHAAMFNSDVMETIPFGVSEEVRKKSGLQEKYTFENFVIGDSNQVAFCAAKSIASEPGNSCPLFIYGGVGLGKTHLMEAIGNEIIQTTNFRVRYMTSGEFEEAYTKAVISNRRQEFRDAMRNDFDVLLIDDIQLLSGKDGTQLEFFHIFNHLQSTNKQIVLTSDRPPHEIRDIEERIRSRFSGSLMVDIQLPTYETRLEIIRKKFRSEGIYPPEDVAQYVASKVATNVREIEGCIQRIKNCANAHKKPICMALAQELIEPFFQTRTVLLDANAIIQCVSRYYGVSQEEILGKSRAKPFVYPRQIAMYLARSHTSLSFPDLGRVFGRDHTTVLHAVQRIMDDKSKDPQLQCDIKRLEDELFKK